MNIKGLKRMSYLIASGKRGSRMFCQRGWGQNIDNVFFFVFSFYYLVDEAREDPNTTISGPSSARQ